MVTEVTPTYYAVGTHTLKFVLKGAGFDALPENAIAVPMINNSEPLQFRYNELGYNVMTMNRMSNTEVQFESTTIADHSPKSIGAILSQDRETIYWVNTTNPLP